VLLGALGSVRAIPAADVTTWLTATQAYLRHDYATAHAGFTRLLRAEWTPAERAKLLWQDAECLRRLDRPAEAATMLERLMQVAPESPDLLQGRPLLYQYYLSAGATEQAEALWREALPRVQRTPYLWDLLTPRLVAFANTAPDRLGSLAEVIVAAKPSAATLTTAVYRPLFAARRLTEARTLHERLQTLFAAKGPPVEIDQQAYDDAWSRDFVDTLITQCRDAIDAGDLEQARLYLTNITVMIPEYPQAAEMRELFDAKFKEPRKD
jgi:tetratricopeptide (TPR) repeat protein